MAVNPNDLRIIGLKENIFVLKYLWWLLMQKSKSFLYGLLVVSKCIGVKYFFSDYLHLTKCMVGKVLVEIIGCKQQILV